MDLLLIFILLSAQGIGDHRILARSDDGGETVVDEHLGTGLLGIEFLVLVPPLCQYQTRQLA